jgi:hypothetical protein
MKSGNLAPYAIFLEEKYGVGILQELDKLYRTPKLWTVEELQELLKKYETYIQPNDFAGTHEEVLSVLREAAAKSKPKLL